MCEFNSVGGNAVFRIVPLLLQVLRAYYKANITAVIIMNTNPVSVDAAVC